MVVSGSLSVPMIKPPVILLFQAAAERIEQKQKVVDRSVLIETYIQ
jgi:hypothetical protein